MRWPDALIAALSLALMACGCATSPDDDLLPGRCGEWRRAGPVREFTAANLHEQIDGAAPFVISFGFRSLAAADYRCGDGPATGIEVYDMGSIDNAFALFRSNASVEATPIEVGTEGVGGEGRVEFWQGPYYVVLSNPSAAEAPRVLALARDLAGAMPATKAWPAYLELLPAAGRVPRSEQYLPADYLGHAFLQRAVSAKYPVAGTEATLFACRYDSPAEAADALASLETFLRGRRPTEPAALGESGFLAEDASYGRMAIFRRGGYVGGMFPYAKGPAADGLLADLDGRLRGQ